MAIGLSVISGSVYACIDYIGTGADGWTFWLHCGTSAGNFGTACDPDGTCYDVTSNDWVAQAQVNIYCQGSQSCQHRDDPIPPEITKLRIGRPMDTSFDHIRFFRRLSEPVPTASLCRDR